MNKDILKEINEVINSLKTLKKENLNKIFLEIKYEDKVEIIEWKISG